MHTLPRYSRLLFPLLLVVLTGACATLKPRSALLERVGKSNMSVGELRIRVRDMARRFPAVLEATADDAAARSDSPELRASLLRFKSNAVPVMQSALLQPDPVAALIDGWALLAQLEQALPKAAPPELVTPFQRSLGELESEVEVLWRELSGREDVANLREVVHTWAGKHPLTGPLITRESTVPLLASFTDRSGVGLLGATAAALQDTQDLIQRTDLYAVSLPRQARWQAEIATQEILGGTPALGPVVDEMGRAVDVLVRVGALAGNTPALVSREREALQDFLSSERRAVLEGVQGERVAVLDAFHSERVQTLAQTDTMGRGWVDHAFDRAEDLVDHIFLWLLGLMVLMLVGLVGVAMLMSRALRRGEVVPWGRSRGGGGPPRDRGPPEAHPDEARGPGPGEERGEPGEHPGEPHH
ncbi:chemotaxis protein [Vitiosangium sp. GDMCC 1.1324]|uniref:chemotaxis protein n=1 Tax=Vitiosangium sp. (strain GDMCC 1.1324) TaxID=2138576 RepID=UPI001E5CB0D5|nr:chemotaxis protein [Vitiosangium sp. GDMCC 1.1324]